MIRILLAFVIAFAAHPALAGCQVAAVRASQRRVVQVVNHAQQQFVAVPHVANTVVNECVILQQVLGPEQYYTVGYGAQQEAYQSNMDAAVEKAVEKKLEAVLDRLVQKLEGRAGQATETGRPHPGQELVKTQGCVQCHNEGSKSVMEGKSPHLFSALGQWIGTDKQAQQALIEVSEGRMPKGKPELSDSDYVVFKDYLSTVSGKGK